MTYGEVKAQFKAQLNRRDVTPSQIEMFVKQSIQRTQRLLRVPASEATVFYPVDNDFDKVTIPGDYLKLVSISIDDHELARASLPYVQQGMQYEGIAKWFARQEGYFLIAPRPSQGSVVRIVYSADFTGLHDDTDINFLTEVAPDVIVAGALSAACAHFNDPRRPAFEEQFTTSIVDLNTQALDDELTNAQVTPGLSFDFDY